MNQQKHDSIGAGSQKVDPSRTVEASPVATQTKEMARAGTEQVKQLGQSVKERALKELDTQRERFAGEVEKLAGSLEKQRGESEALSPILDLAATATRKLSATLSDRSAEDLFRGITRSPVGVLAGSFALGFLALRLFKA